MVTTRRAAAKARGEAEPRKRYTEEDEEVGAEFEEGIFSKFKLIKRSQG